ncbi:MAG: aminotransferase class V-fold PLP-dependent enzyme [Bryobacterales bacterium]|nr:aminotransferase class V-fold PLP-dependent enzyme [Bryobacterales bacterium]
MVDPLLEFRREFPVVEKTLYMISHSLGAMPQRTRACLNEYAELWSTRSIRAWEEGWWAMPVSVGDLIGRIIGAGPGEVVMQPNVSVAQWIIHSCLNWSGPRNKLVSEDLNFPTNIYIFHELERQGARLVKVASEDGITAPLEKMLDAIDEQTLLVSVSHVIYRSSAIQDLGAIVRKAHAVGAMVVGDLYQSAGTVPVDVKALNLDFAVGGSVKWLCGGPGAGYLYVRPDHVAKLRPQLTGWMAHRESFGFAHGPIHYADDMFRFLHGTPAIPALYAAKSGYEIVLEAGVDRIREKSMRQTQWLVELAQEAGYLSAVR